MEYTPPKSLIDLMPHHVITGNKAYEIKPTVVDQLTEFSRLPLSSGLVLVKYTDDSLYTLHTTDEQYNDWVCVTDPMLKEVLNMLQYAECRIDELQRELAASKQKVEIIPANEPNPLGKTSEQIARTRLEHKAATFTKLRELLGYIENGTDTKVEIFQDDADHSYMVRIGNNRNTYYCGSSLELAITNAFESNKDN